MKKTNKCTKYQTDIHEKKTKTMKSSTTNKNNALLNKTSQMNQVTDCIVSTTSAQSIINVDHPLVKLGYVIFEMSGDLKKIPQRDESTRKFTQLFNNKKSSNQNILGSDDKKRLHHQIDNVTRNKNINNYMDDVCNFVMDNIKGLPEVYPLITSILVRKNIARNKYFTETERMDISLLYQ